MSIDSGSIAPFFVVGLIAWLVFRRRQGTSPASIAMTATFAIYVFLVAKYALLPLRFDSGYVDVMRRETTLSDGINLVPLMGMSELLTVQIVGNVLLGIPFGFLLPFVRPSMRSIPKVLVAGFVAFGLVELSQLAISLAYGFAYRVIDINDLILNLVGVALGAVLLWLLARFYRVSLSADGHVVPDAWSTTLLSFGTSSEAEAMARRGIDY